jgi:hypothetical protein
LSEINSLSRVLQIMLRLLDGEELFLQELNTTYGKHNETIKKDIAIIRNELMHKPLEIQYSRSRRSYKLIGLDEENSGTKFSSAIVVLMVMYGCRGLSAEEVKQVEHFITGSFAPSMQQRLKKFASSYRFHYKPILKQPIFAFIELAFQCITRQQMIRITYTTIYHETQYFDIMPYTLIYDEGYFYLIAEPAGSKRVEGNIFRIDQISHYEVLNEPFTVQQHGTDYFKPGEFANHTFFMHYGESTMVIRLRMRPFIESYFVAKFPVHQLIERGEEWLIYECTVMHGESALFWIFSERHWVELLSPSWLRERVKYFLAEMLDLYRD